ncbi:hypothetical protein DXG01_012447 [Tephrocybe rancida]|nr:hypothetical protein DXG01_012447 [Tephrocybe rancida]
MVTQDDPKHSGKGKAREQGQAQGGGEPEATPQQAHHVAHNLHRPPSGTTQCNTDNAGAPTTARPNNVTTAEQRNNRHMTQQRHTPTAAMSPRQDDCPTPLTERRTPGPTPK